MNTDTKIFLRKKFTEYYTKNSISAPAGIEQREFGTGTLDKKIKVRHKSFKSERDLQNYLRRDAPFYISYSTAYYEFPENQPMTAKNWLGADLVFDLDLDMGFFDSERLESVKEETLSLVDFLLSDFGLSKRELDVNFSGSKGYHIHVFNEGVKHLGNEERREIVDYVSGNIDFREYLSLSVETTTRKSVITGPRKGDKGWSGRVYAGLYDFIEQSSLEDLKEIPGVGEKKATLIHKNRDKILKELGLGRYNYIPEIISIETACSRTEDPNVKVPVIGKVSSPIVQKIIDEKAVKTMAAINTDEMVTIDTSRLIRLPDSLHGGSGLIAKKIRDMDRFNPLTDAIAFNDENIKVAIREKIPEFDMNEQRIGPFNGGEVEVPEYAGVYLLLRDKAELVKG